MKKYIFLVLIMLYILISQFSSNFESSELKIDTIPSDFSYDGCSMFPDADMLDCCTEHDQEYFFGGTWQERLKSDNDLYSCVAQKNHWYSNPLASIMWIGVRLGGHPVTPTSFRWGFGRDIY